MPKQSVLFICTHNSARSQMAEGLLRARLGDHYEALSAGTVATQVNPFAVEAMAEIGVDISGHRSKRVDEFLDRDIDFVVTVCDSARDNCPYFPARIEIIHKSFTDPSAVNGNDDQKLMAFRSTRDEVDGWIRTRFG